MIYTQPIEPSGLLSTRQAAELLGVKPATLYAYVSRGLVTPVRRGDRRSGSWFRRADVERLARRGRQTSDASVFQVSSGVTVIDGRPWYRGHDALELAVTARFEQVAELLWTSTLPIDPVRWPVDAAGLDAARTVQAVLPPNVLAVERVRLAVVALGALDPLRFDLSPTAVAFAGRRLLATVVAALPPAGRAPAAESPIAARLWASLTSRRASPAALAALDGALVLLADHELAGSTVAARVAASYRADPYAVVAAGLAAASGTTHGGASLEAERLLEEIRRDGDVATVLSSLLRRGESVPGLGQFLYPDGDPRFGVLVELARRAFGRSRVLDDVARIAELAAERGLPPPNVDLGLACLSRAAGWPLGSGELVFVIARTAGWLAHAMEEYAQPSHFRPRAIIRAHAPGAPDGLTPP